MGIKSGKIGFDGLEASEFIDRALSVWEKAATYGGPSVYIYTAQVRLSSPIVSC